MDTDPIALDGFLDEETVPGDLEGSTARFRLTVSPTDERTDEMILPCSVADPVLAHSVIHDLEPGDKLRVTGYLRLPRTPDEPMWLVVSTLAVLDTAPLLSDPASVATAVLERYGPYVCWFDAEDSGEVPVWTEAGVWVGHAGDPSALGELIEEFEQRQAAGE
ncbi:hypothetical protein [Streptomyces antarcticus]|uniref:hypothetical protein n=1 Tax=Streptomyces antarcticus TaxID=2996458 RepID=UPI00226E807D|nr:MULTISPECIES: hypothetical protein [unclassified Streptomyces]MCY0947012.1 hypothetical protein [Streptomyces sp. H34-AA3]MCZ4088135.1 hypothetical protein [Streptomyces sp. H34-S5]